MENFVYDIGTKVYFGKGQIYSLKDICKELGKKVLIIYGGGSIKKNGIYDTVIQILESIKMDHFELSGVEPNPRIETVRKGIDICRKQHIDFLLAIGGGSTIDCSKAIAAGAASTSDIWDIIKHPENLEDALPIVSVVTLAATGSEMDCIGVISDIEKNEKNPFRHEKLRPAYSILDPEYTFTVSKYQTASGTADIISHLMESYFSKAECYMQERICEGLLKTCIHYGVIAYNDPTNYEARANLMWTSSWAINDYLKLMRPVAWSVHAMEHQLSAYYDVTHGVGLAILTPAWMRYVCNDSTVKDFSKFARNVWGIQEEDDYLAAELGIKCLEGYFRLLGLPKSLSEIGINDDSNFKNMAKKAKMYLMDNIYYPLSEEDILKIYYSCSK